MSLTALFIYSNFNAAFAVKLTENRCAWDLSVSLYVDRMEQNPFDCLYIDICLFVYFVLKRIKGLVSISENMWDPRVWVIRGKGSLTCMGSRLRGVTELDFNVMREKNDDLDLLVIVRVLAVTGQEQSHQKFYVWVGEIF